MFTELWPVLRGYARRLRRSSSVHEIWFCLAHNIARCRRLNFISFIFIAQNKYQHKREIVETKQRMPSSWDVFGSRVHLNIYFTRWGKRWGRELPSILFTTPNNFVNHNTFYVRMSLSYSAHRATLVVTIVHCHTISFHGTKRKTTNARHLFVENRNFYSMKWERVSEVYVLSIQRKIYIYILESNRSPER